MGGITYAISMPTPLLRYLQSSNNPVGTINANANTVPGSGMISAIAQYVPGCSMSIAWARTRRGLGAELRE